MTSSLHHILRVTLDQTFGFSENRYFWRKDRRKFARKMLIYLCFLGFLPLFLEYLKFIDLALLALPPQGKSLFLLLPVFSGQMMVLVLGIFYIIGVFYMSKSIGILLPLPIPTRHIICSLFLITVVGEYITLAFIYIPPIVLYGVKMNVHFPYWIYASLLFLLIPFLPLSLVSIPVMIGMRCVNLTRHRDLFRILLGLVLVGFILGFQLFFHRLYEGDGEISMVLGLLADGDAFLLRAGRVFPPALWCARILIHHDSVEGLKYLLLFVACLAASVKLMIHAGERVYLKGLLSGTEIRAGRTPPSRVVTARWGKAEASHLRALLTREILIFFKNPYFVMNYAITLVFPIFILTVTVFLRKEGTPEITALIRKGDAFELFITFLAGAVILGIISYNSMFVSATGISREGPRFWISRILPLSPRKQILAKLAFSWIVAMPIALAGSAALGLHFDLPLERSFLILYIVIVGAVPVAALGLFTDLVSPNLGWTDPHRVVRGNLRPLIAFFGNICWIFLTGYGLYRLFTVIADPAIPIVSLLCFISLLALASVTGLLLFADRRYRGIESP